MASEGGDPGERFRPEHRLRRRAEFLHVQRRGRKIHAPHFLLVILPREVLGPTRLGITITRKVAGAVGRNRVKRVLREVFRRNRALFPASCDIVVIAKSGAPSLGYEAARAELARLEKPLLRAAQAPRLDPPPERAAEREPADEP